MTRPTPSPSTRRAGRTVASGATALALVVLTLGPGMELARGAEAGACVPTTESPTLTVESGPVAIGGTLEVSGAGWCHPTDGGSSVALKIDEGAYSRLDTSIHRNQTIWTIVEADPADGTFSIEMQLPDGTPATSEPAFAGGTHTLRALTGSIKPGDVVRSVQSGEFVVGEHRPQGIPDPVDPGRLTSASVGGLRAALDGRRLALTLPDGQADDWVFVSLLAPDGSPRHPWGATWHRLTAGGRLALGPGEAPVDGVHRVVVQDGNPGQVGELLGWSTVTYPVPQQKPAPGKKKPKPAPGKSSTPTPTVPAPAQAPAAPVLPLATPAPDGVATLPTALTAPVGAWADLRAVDRLDATLEGAQLEVRTGRAEVQLFVHVYDATSSSAAGWTATDVAGRAALDLTSLPPGSYRLTLTDGDENLVGWAEATLAAAGVEQVDAVQTAGVSSRAASDAPWVSSTDGWLAGVGAALLLGALIGRGRKEKSA